MVASGRGIRNRFTLEPTEGMVLPEDFTAQFEAALAAGESTFETADGSAYRLEATKVEAKVYERSDLALASKRIFTGEGDETFSFRLAAERAIIQGDGSAFEADGQSYTVALSSEGVASFLNAAGEEVAEASHFAIKASEVGTVFPEGFSETVQDAIAGRLTRFTLLNAEGEEVLYLLERNAREYIVRTEQSTYQILMNAYPSAEHWMGTDGNGMDVLTRLMYGGRVSLIIGFIVVFLETLIGVIIGGVAGYFGKWVDNALMRLVDIFNCIPALPIYIIVGAIMDEMKVDSLTRILLLMVLMGILGWPGIARVVRGQILSLREQEFMTAAEATGLSVKRRIFRHLVPNVIPQLIVISTMTLGSVILMEAVLSFLGLGAKYPLASWGSIINAVSNIYVMTNYWFVWIPAGMLILLTVLGFNFVGDGLRDALDPRMRD